MGSLWVKISSIYFILGVVFGLSMSAAAMPLNYAAGHAHVGLVGWVSMALFGAIYSIYPKAGNSLLGKWHFWLYQIGSPILLVSMFAIQEADAFGGMGVVHILTFVGGGAVALGIILFIINSFVNINQSTKAKQTKDAA